MFSLCSAGGGGGEVVRGQLVLRGGGQKSTTSPYDGTGQKSSTSPLGQRSITPHHHHNTYGHYGLWAGSTHPTGMHSSFASNYVTRWQAYCTQDIQIWLSKFDLEKFSFSTLVLCGHEFILLTI